MSVHWTENAYEHINALKTIAWFMYPYMHPLPGAVLIASRIYRSKFGKPIVDINNTNC